MGVVQTKSPLSLTIETLQPKMPHVGYFWPDTKHGPSHYSVCRSGQVQLLCHMLEMLLTKHSIVGLTGCVNKAVAWIPMWNENQKQPTKMDELLESQWTSGAHFPNKVTMKSSLILHYAEGKGAKISSMCASPRDSYLCTPAFPFQ